MRIPEKETDRIIPFDLSMAIGEINRAKLWGILYEKVSPGKFFVNVIRGHG